MENRFYFGSPRALQIEGCQGSDNQATSGELYPLEMTKRRSE